MPKAIKIDYMKFYKNTFIGNDFNNSTSYKNIDIEAIKPAQTQMLTKSVKHTLSFSPFILTIFILPLCRFS
jgi:penicillin-binding protein-related factor A (putative recombinase)